VLGSAAGGGYPQWNCRCSVCQLAWDRDCRVRRRTQSSIALQNQAGEIVLLNASPDLRQQIIETEALQPRTGLRDSPLRAIVLTNADVDHIAGLLTVRERWPFRLYASAAVMGSLAANPLFGVLATDCVEMIEIGFDSPFQPIPGISLSLFPVPGKVPLWGEADHSEALDAHDTAETAIADGRTVGVAFGGTDALRNFYIPGCATLSPDLAGRLRDAELLLFDGTLFRDDEMIREKLGMKTGRRMGHMPIDGPGGSLEAFAAMGISRRIYIHINNSNPILVEGSPERRAVEGAGWKVAEDGMEIDA
jgi:pyrroloquinoline quinone biosynthesis protein B